MAEPTMNDYILVTRKNFLSEDNNEKMIEKSLLEIEGTFLVKIRDNAYKGIDGENVFIHINKFLKVVEPLKIRGLSHDRFRLSVFPTLLSGAVSEWFTKECIGTITTWENLVEKFVQKFYHLFDHIEEEEDDEEYDPHTFDDVPEIFKIEDDLFLFDTPLCIAFEEFNHLFKRRPLCLFKNLYVPFGIPFDPKRYYKDEATQEYCGGQVPFPRRLHNYCCDDLKEARGVNVLDAYDNNLPQKEKDPGSFTLPCLINNICFNKALVDLGASVSVMPFSTYTNLGLGDLSYTRMTIELADRTIKQPKGITANVLVRIDKFVFPIDFVVLDIPEDDDVPLILG
ncbi:hypothetical protein Tco_0980878 [Tanacetum coccineum]